MNAKPGYASVAQRCITAEAAAAAVAAAVAHADALGVRINAAVVDGAGTLMAFLRMPGDEALRLGMPHRPRLVVFGGGLPLREGGELIGGIGVSGASAEQDEACARAGLRATALE